MPPWNSLTACTRTAPPVKSRPEAANFPAEQYTFAGERKRFQPPPQYPDAPQDMWYSLPESKPAPAAPPTPIFPWEKKHRPTTSRIFAEDLPPSPKLEKCSPSGWEESAGGMDRYIKNIMEDQARKAAASPSDPAPSGRRESLLISGFPPGDARPSLPVTPAPIMTNTFWGDERGEDDPKLPPAEGVTGPAEWVCPQCGFSSTDNSAFSALHDSSFRHDSVVAAESDATDAPSPKDIKSSVSRPIVRPRHSSSDASAISAATTVVPIVTVAEPVPEQGPEPEPEPEAELEHEPEPESEPEPELEPEAEVPPPPLLLPPAWLTGALVDQTSEKEEPEDAIVLKDAFDAQLSPRPLSTKS
jgi:glycogenin glucosyltransferase